MPCPQHSNSRLGQILISKGLITSAQLDAAIKLQLVSRQRLGEVLLEQGLVTQKQLSKALKKQTNLRLAATLVAALLSPFQMASADIQRLQPPDQHHPPGNTTRHAQPERQRNERG